MIMVERKSKKRKDKVASIISKVMVIFTLDTLACISGNLETETADMISKRKYEEFSHQKHFFFE